MINKGRLGGPRPLPSFGIGAAVAKMKPKAPVPIRKAPKIGIDRKPQLRTANPNFAKYGAITSQPETDVVGFKPIKTKYGGTIW